MRSVKHLVTIVRSCHMKHKGLLRIRNVSFAISLPVLRRLLHCVHGAVTRLFGRDACYKNRLPSPSLGTGILDNNRYNNSRYEQIFRHSKNYNPSRSLTLIALHLFPARLLDPVLFRTWKFFTLFDAEIHGGLPHWDPRDDLHL
jgi:hypothetical protein